MDQLEIRRKEISEELGIPIELVTVYPYKPPKDYPDPTPFRLWLEGLYTKWSEESDTPVEKIGSYTTQYYTYNNPFKEEQEWQKMIRKSS